MYRKVPQKDRKAQFRDGGDVAISVVETVDDVVDEAMELAPSIDGFHIEPRCRVCRNDEMRKKVNDLLASGVSYTMILRAIEDANGSLDKRDRVTIDSAGPTRENPERWECKCDRDAVWTAVWRILTPEQIRQKFAPLGKRAQPGAHSPAT